MTNSDLRMITLIEEISISYKTFSIHTVLVRTKGPKKFGALQLIEQDLLSLPGLTGFLPQQLIPELTV